MASLLQKATKLLIDEYGGYVARETYTVDFPIGVDQFDATEVCIPFSHFTCLEDIREFAQGLSAAGSLRRGEGVDGGASENY